MRRQYPHLKTLDDSGEGGVGGGGRDWPGSYSAGIFHLPQVARSTDLVADQQQHIYAEVDPRYVLSTTSSLFIEVVNSPSDESPFFQGVTTIRASPRTARAAPTPPRPGCLSSTTATTGDREWPRPSTSCRHLLLVVNDSDMSNTLDVQFSSSSQIARVAPRFLLINQRNVLSFFLSGARMHGRNRQSHNVGEWNGPFLTRLSAQLFHIFLLLHSICQR